MKEKIFMMKQKRKQLLSIILVFSILFSFCLPDNVKPIHARVTDYHLEFSFKGVTFYAYGDLEICGTRPITPSIYISAPKDSDTIIFPTASEFKQLVVDTSFRNGVFTDEMEIHSETSTGWISSVKKLIIPSDYYVIPQNFSSNNASIEEIVINSNNNITLEKECFSNMSALKKVTIDASSVIFNGSVFSGCKNLETVTITGDTTFTNGNTFSGCSNLTTVTFNSKVNFNGTYAEFPDCSFNASKGGTINFNGTVTNTGCVFHTCSNITAINFKGYDNKLSNKFIYHSSINNLNIENQTTLGTSFLYDNTTHTITNLSFNGKTTINDKAFYQTKIKNMYFNIDNRNNTKSISYVNPTDRLGYQTKVNNIYFNYKDFNQNTDKVLELNNFPLGNTTDTSLNCDAIYFLNPNFKYIGGSDYDRCDGGTTNVYGYGGAVAYDTNGNIISSYEMYQSWIENKHCTFTNYVSNAETLTYSLKNNVIYLPSDAYSVAYDFSSTDNITACATYLDNTTPFNEINTQLKNNPEYPLTMALGEKASNFNYRILEKNNSVSGASKNSYVYKHGNDYYTVCTNSVVNLTEGEHDFLIEVGGVKHPFKITVKKNRIEQITDIQPKSGNPIHLTYGEALEKDMLTVRARYTNGDTVILTNDQFEIENPVIAEGNLTITISAKSDNTNKVSKTIKVNGYPDEAKSFEVTCKKTEMPTGSTLNLSDVQLKNVSYLNPAKPADAVIENGFTFIVDGKKMTEVPIKADINIISVSYKNYVLNNAIVIKGVENKITKVEATYIGTGVYENCNVPNDASVLAVYIYKNDSTGKELVTDYSKITFDTYKIIANQDNAINVYYDGIKAENAIIVPGLKDGAKTLNQLTYNGPCTIGTKLNPNNFYIEVTLLSGTVVNSNVAPDLLGKLTFSAETLNEVINQITVTYDGSLQKTITIDCDGTDEITPGTPSPSTGTGSAITSTPGAIIVTGPAVTSTPGAIIATGPAVSQTPIETPIPTETVIPKPTLEPTIAPTAEPTITPTTVPPVKPAVTPTVKPTEKPTVKKGNTYTVNNIKYKVCNFNQKEKTVEIIGYKKSAKSLSIKGKVKINGYSFTVVRIENNAFKSCTALKGTLHIPATVTAIGNSAFYGCKKITKVIVGKKVKSIGSRCFYQCSNLKLVDLRPTKKLAKVGKEAFKHNSSSRAFKIPNGTTSRFSKLLRGAY